jgi:hypothetical protein
MMIDPRAEVEQIKSDLASERNRPPTPSCDLSNIPADCPACIDHILKALPPKSEQVNYNKLALNIACYFKARGYKLEAVMGIANSFIEKYSTSESHNTPQKRRDNFESVWKSIASGNGYKFDCSYILGLKLPGSAFECDTCAVKRNGENPAVKNTKTAPTSPRVIAPEPAHDSPEVQGESKPIAAPIAPISPVKGLPPPLTPEDTRIHLTARPRDPDYILNFQGVGMITRGSVGGIVGGSGMGKTTLMIHLIVMMVLGIRWAFFEAPRPLRVLFLPAEDDQDQVDRKVWDTTSGKLIEGLHVKSVRGLIGPLMVYDGGNPVPGPWWEWLKQTIVLHHPLDVLMLDPKSRFYGLEENSNEENVAWVQCLEKLSQETGVAIIFSHHPPKGTKELNQWMARGGGGLVDACRWFMGMLPMSEEEGRRYGVNDWMNHFQAAVIKTNIGPKSKGSAWFRMNENGLIEAADVVELKESNWGRRLAELLQDRLQDADCSPKYLTAHDLMKEKEGKSVYEIMRECFAGFRRRTDMRGAIEWAVKWNLIKEVDVPQEKGRKRIELVPLADAMKESKIGF